MMLRAVVVVFWMVCGVLSSESTNETRNLSRQTRASSEKSRHIRSTKLLTIIVTTCGPSLEKGSLRFPWLLVTLRTYLSREYDDILYRILVVWNSEKPVAPELLNLVKEEEKEGRHKKLVIVEAGSSSLNNRWIKTIPYVATEVVVNVDDDVVALKPALRCLMENSRPGYVAGPFARTVGHFFNYSTDERTSGPRPDYALILPKVMALRREHLIAYSKAPREFLRYIDSEPSHSDDILLNLVAAKKLRLIPPAGSVVDYDRVCHQYVAKPFEGLGTMRHRPFARTAAMRTMGLHYTDKVIYSHETKTCELFKVSVDPSSSTKNRRFLSSSSSSSIHDDTRQKNTKSSTRHQSDDFIITTRDLQDYEHRELLDDIFPKLRKHDADLTAHAICQTALGSTSTPKL